MDQPVCSQCESVGPLTNLFGFHFCDRCATKLRLQADSTILKNAEAFEQSESATYEEEVLRRLQSMDRSFAKGKVKLLHILSRLDELR